MNNQLYISTKNRKMKNGFMIFNLPAGQTCPGKTPLCRYYCYAKHSEIFYKDVFPARQKNYEISLQDNFVDLMIKKISTKIKYSKNLNGCFRIHESGDFYNQKYLDYWKFITSIFKNIKFLAFTKSFHLDFSDLPKNFQVVNSIMADTKIKPSNNFPIAYVGNIAYNKKTTIECQGACHTCFKCWRLHSLKKDVHFKIHGIKKEL